MADNKTGSTSLKAYVHDELGKSTLISSPRISIPMPSGAKPSSEQTTQKPAAQAPKPRQ